MTQAPSQNLLHTVKIFKIDLKRTKNPIYLDTLWNVDIKSINTTYNDSYGKLKAAVEVLLVPESSSDVCRLFEGMSPNV